MSDISIIGLGAMGTALARALVQAGHSVTVWNRSPEKMDSVVALGADGAARLEDALGASPKIMICINDYASTARLLDRPEVTPLLRDRTVIQSSTGTPKEAGDSDIWFRAQGATYMDAAIMVYPDTVGTPEAQILVAGPEAAFQDCRPLLQSLAGDLRYLGPNIRAAAALDLALLSRLMGIVFGTIHGAHLCEAEGISVAQLAALLPAGDRGRTIAQVIHDDSFEVGGAGATVEVSMGAVTHLQDQARDAGINSELPDLLMSWLKRAKAAGYGSQESASVVRILRESGRTDNGS
jgi:3-hydroxyisobutyrate dehydrogenase-like beta-hydroxyacid dehydrogenase